MSKKLAGSRSIEELLAHSEFLNLLIVICKSVYRKLAIGKRDASYTADDLFGDVCVRLVKVMNQAKAMNTDTFRPENIPDEDALFSWLYVLVLNRGLSKLREIKRRPSCVNEKPVEDHPIPDPGAGPERLSSVQELLDFTQPLRKERRRALMLWLADFSFREIAAILNREGIKCSHVTVQKWVADSLKVVARRAS